MNHAFAVHVIQRIEHLVQEEPTSIFAHGAHSLAQIEEESSLNELHHNKDKVFDDSAGWFHNCPCITIFMHLDNSKVVEILENCNLVVDGKNGVTVSAKELFLQDFDGTVVVAS